MRVRYRVDGMLQEAMTLPKDLQYPMASRLKIMASMDIAERRAPQDGRLTLVTPSGEYDFRLSTYPALHGENIVIRILDKRAGRITLNNIGMQPDVLEGIERITARPQGMFLVCGPTGSGKTTTLYACLNALNSVDRNIMTIEDPIEYQLPGIIQGNVNVKAGVTFVTGLRTLVRQDPDIILVGEIRDTDTARIAIQAALTGHFRPFHDPCQRRGERHYAPVPHGRRAVSDRVRPDGYARAAPDALQLRQVRHAGDSQRKDASRSEPGRLGH